MSHFLSNIIKSPGDLLHTDPLLNLVSGRSAPFGARHNTQALLKAGGEGAGFPFAQNSLAKYAPQIGPIAGAIVGGYFSGSPWGAAAGGALGGYLTAPEGDRTKNTLLGGAGGYLGGTLGGYFGGAAGGSEALVSGGATGAAGDAGAGGILGAGGSAASAGAGADFGAGAAAGSGASNAYANLTAEQASNLSAASAGGGGGGGGGVGSYLQGLMGGMGGGGGGGGLSNTQLGLGLGSTAYSIYGAQQLQKAGKDAAAQADPFGPYRAQYAQQLGALEANPTSIESDPSYAASVQAVRRAMAKGGYTMSGNELTALQQNFGQQFQQREQSLAGLAGANIGPNPGLALQGQVAGTQLMGNSFANLGYMAMLAGS